MWKTPHSVPGLTRTGGTVPIFFGFQDLRISNDGQLNTQCQAAARPTPTPGSRWLRTSWSTTPRWLVQSVARPCTVWPQQRNKIAHFILPRLLWRYKCHFGSGCRPFQAIVTDIPASQAHSTGQAISCFSNSRSPFLSRSVHKPLPWRTLPLFPFASAPPLGASARIHYSAPWTPTSAF